VHLLRYRDSSTGVIGVGVLRRDTISTIPGVTSLAQLWRLSREDLQAAVTGATGEQCTLADVTVAAPVDGRTEVWACGVPTRSPARPERRRASAGPAHPGRR
jgi:2-dehydro-3-deoxy-D-arabinonate dehydratase